MQPPDWKNATEEQVWQFVAVHLKQRGIDTVLVGGAVAAIYSKGIYKSGDLDFVKESPVPYVVVEEFLKEIGFFREGKHFVHPQCRHIIIEFVAPPLAIGEDYRIKPKKKKINNIVLKILSPTDCIKDRLCSFIYFRNRDALDQAVLVARHNRHSIAEIERWCRAEGKAGVEAFKEFKRLLRTVLAD